MSVRGMRKVKDVAILSIVFSGLIAVSVALPAALGMGFGATLPDEDTSAYETFGIIVLPVSLAGFAVFFGGAAYLYLRYRNYITCQECKHTYWKHFDRKDHPLQECTEKKCTCNRFISKEVTA